MNALWKFASKVFLTIFAVFAAYAVTAADQKPTDWIKSTTLYQMRVASYASDIAKYPGKSVIQVAAAHLKDLSDMGIKTVWLMPIFASPQGDDGYDVSDYMAINPGYGTIDDLKDFVSQAHKLDMKVLLDLPTNHCSEDNPLFSSKDDKVRKDKWFVWSKTDKGWPKPWQNNNGKLYPDNTWFKDPTTLNRGYYYALFNDFQPDFNYNDSKSRKEVYDYFMSVMKFWIQECDIDGFRCDAVRYLAEGGYAKQKDLVITHKIWQKTRKDLDKIKPSFILLAEAATETDAELLSYYGNGDEFNSGLHFRFPTKLMDTIKNGSRSADFLDSLFIVQDNIPDFKRQPQACVDSLFLNNHDGFVGDRVATQLKGDLVKEKAAASLYILMSGIPVIYYGDEIGLQVLPPSAKYQNRGPYDWRAYETQKTDPNSLLNHYTRLLKLRSSYPALSRGDSLFVNAGYCETPDTTSIVWDADTEKASPILAMLRHVGTNKDNSQDILVVHNFSSKPCYIFADLTNFSDLADYYSGKFFVGRNVVPLMGGEWKSYPDIKADNNTLYPLGLFAPSSTKVFLLGKVYDASYITYENAVSSK
ncbi:MAG: alpha-amylase family glycosyl hydrolase [Lentisphaerota bacterium]